MQLSHGVLGSPFKRPPTVCAKTVSSLLRESTKTINANNCFSKHLQDKGKRFALRIEVLFPDMTTVFHSCPYGRFIEIQSNIRKKTL